MSLLSCSWQIVYVCGWGGIRYRIVWWHMGGGQGASTMLAWGLNILSWALPQVALLVSSLSPFAGPSFGGFCCCLLVFRTLINHRCFSGLTHNPQLSSRLTAVLDSEWGSWETHQWYFSINDQRLSRSSTTVNLLISFCSSVKRWLWR